MPPPDLRRRVTSYLPFVVVAVAGQLSVAWPPGPTDSVAFRISTLLLVAILALMVVRRGMPPRTFIVGAGLYMASVSLLMVASGGMGSGLGVLVFMPVVGVALYGKRWESAVCVVFLVSAIMATQIASSAGSIDAMTLVRRLILIGAFGAMLSLAIQLLRSRLVESNAHTERLLRHEEALNAAVRQLVQLSEPPQITALGAATRHGHRGAARVGDPPVVVLLD